eukprot:TRINITY_DN405_c0_g1_i1.p1 TRINITY_DN405_c0_g1~~TRINITY_DN405_c0_g1_i1.p1  ORF type:complete len:140 (+),score=23.55 TRINITY_DN405_c0_g1_i1:274-693(+)
MASLAAVASASCATAASSSFVGQKLKVASEKAGRTAPAQVGVRAKYGDESVYFDLQDIENTTGSWDMYGTDNKARYNGLQNKFFETFAAPLTKRGLVFKGLLLGGGAILVKSLGTATGDVLPIQKGPQQPPTPGPNGKI